MEAEGSSISPRRFALQYSPPLLVLEYVDEPTRRLKHLRVHMEKALRSEVRDSGMLPLGLGQLRGWVTLHAWQTPEIVSRLRRKFPTHLAHPAVKEEKVRHTGRALGAERAFTVLRCAARVAGRSPQGPCRSRYWIPVRRSRRQRGRGGAAEPGPEQGPYTLPLARNACSRFLRPAS